MSLTNAEAKLKLSLLNSNVADLDRIDVITQFTNMDLPQEVISRIDVLWEIIKVIGDQVIHIGKLILTEIMKFIKQNQHLAIGIAIGAAIGALISIIPFIGPLLAPIATAIGGIAGYKLDQGENIKGGVIGVTQDVIMIAKKFFELFSSIFNTLQSELS